MQGSIFMIIKNDKRGNNTVIFSKWIYLSFVVSLLILFTILLVSCNKKVDKPLFKILDVNFVSSIDEDMVQKGINGETLYLAEHSETQKPEILYMHINLDNPKAAPIDYVTVNNTKYINQDESIDKTNTFSVNSYYSQIIVKLSALTSNVKQITLNGIGYRLPNERVDYKTQLNMNVTYNPEFVVTCDLTEISNSEEHTAGVNIIYDGDGNVVKKTKELSVRYLGRFILPYNNLELILSERYHGGRCPLGKGFVGWYTVEEEPKLVNPNDTIFYSYVKNIEIKPKFIDRYLYEDCEYDGEQGVAIKGVNIEPVMYKNNPILKNELKNEYIPDEYQNKPILGISPRAFSSYKAGDFEIHLGNNIRYIGENAFEGVKKLKIDLNAVEEIKDAAFKNCGEITLINKEFPKTLWKIGKEAFYGATPVEYVVKNVDELSSTTARLLKGVFIPNTVTYIGDSAFETSEIVSLYFEHGLSLDRANFGKSSFANCRELKTFAMNVLRPVDPSPLLKINEIEPTTITIIPEKTFYNSVSMKCDIGSTFVNNGVNGYVYLAEGIEDIEKEAFAISNLSASENNFKYLAFPSSLKYLRSSAFSNVKLSNIAFPSNSNLIRVEDNVFNNSIVEEVVFPKLNYFGKNVFINNPKLEAIFIDSTDMPFEFGPQKSSLRDLGFMNAYFKFFVPDDKFQNFKDINAEAPDVQKRILSSKYVHERHETYKDVLYRYKIAYEDINPGVNDDIRITNIWGNIPYETTIPEIIYYNDDGITVHKIVKELGPYCFLKPVSKVTLPEAVTKIGDFAFHDNSSLYWVNILNENSGTNLETIGQYAFTGTAITNFASNSNLKFIGANCFVRCNDLKTVKLIKGTSIDIRVAAFNSCGVEKVYIGNNDVIKTLGASAFSNCKNLKYAYIEFSDVNKISKELFGLPLAVYVFKSAHQDLEVCFFSQAIASNMLAGYDYFEENKIYYTNWKENGMPDEENKILVYPLG